MRSPGANAGPADLQNAAIAGMIYQNLPDPEVEESEESPVSILREQDRKNGDSAVQRKKRAFPETIWTLKEVVGIYRSRTQLHWTIS